MLKIFHDGLAINPSKIVMLDIFRDTDPNEVFRWEVRAHLDGYCVVKSIECFETYGDAEKYVEKIVDEINNL